MAHVENVCTCELGRLLHCLEPRCSHLSVPAAVTVRMNSDQLCKVLNLVPGKLQVPENIRSPM